MDTKKLRQKILDLAIRGKLVSQDPNDEPASVLIEKIRSEKEQLIKEKRIKRDKNESYIYRSDKSYYEKLADGTVKCIDEEIPFEIPESWEWCRLGSIAKSVLYGVSESAQKEGNYKLLRITDIQNNSVKWENVPFTTLPKDKVSEYLLASKDILFARTGATVGKSYLVNEVNNNVIYASYLIRVRLFDLFESQYIKFYFESGFYWRQITDKSIGVGQPNVNGTSLKSLLIPIPPYKEQLLIGKRALELTGIIENVNINKKNLSDDIQETKSKILDLAIRGKLVPQDPNDEPASVLLERIKAEHPESKKKTKNTGDNSHYQNLPFEIPKNWMWVKGYSCFNPMESTKPTGDSFIYIDIDAIDNKAHKVINPKTIKKKDTPSRATRKLSTGDTLFSMVRPYLENIAFIDYSLNNCIASTGFYVCKPNALLFPTFCFNLMTSKYVIDGLNTFMKGDNSPSINNDNILNWLYPIPPFEEQIRITKRISSLYSLLDEIMIEL
jgi:type I restriction enzyme S subunit